MDGDEDAMGGDTAIRDAFTPLEDTRSLDPLLERVGGARFVLLGESSHGTSEFYRWRAAITARLVREKGFSLIAVEGDWPDCLDVHRHLTDDPRTPEDPADALAGFARWPRWMWANREVADLLAVLRGHNAGRPPADRVGFFGLDVYSLWESLRAILDYLRAHHPDQVDAALEAYRCFEPYTGDERAYARSTALVPPGCAEEVASLLAGTRRRAAADDTGAGISGGGGLTRLAAVQNAEVVANAEGYYRAMVGGGPQAWNIRDRHMAATLDRLIEHGGPGAKVVVWAHNTHIGDARATDMAAAGMVNLGQLVRERHAADGVVAVGFGTHSGTVVAGRRWGGDPEVMEVPPARAGSLEDRLHRALPSGASLAVFPEKAVGESRGEVAGDAAAEGRGDAAGQGAGKAAGAAPGEAAAWGSGWLGETLDHRAIGVVYHPEREARGNYVPTVAGQRYDAFVHVDRTTALHPLHGTEPPAPREPETYPSGV
ncbi:erythromycin esterase family protein [Streptomonospora nanhaiensis]|uniref:erythromycin esterase family protein n=1 Tax=Streptomonospora nanhaiensis TaxID=1323731 RepID=UPI001FEB96EF|nr:erythromycin esterase family protein [Streptomonospora nanhaiensis]